MLDFSRYLEEILSQNPSDHPTIVLSQIKFNELKHLVDFMYAGEVAVEQNNLNILLVSCKNAPFFPVGGSTAKLGFS